MKKNKIRLLLYALILFFMAIGGYFTFSAKKYHYAVPLYVSSCNCPCTKALINNTPDDFAINLITKFHCTIQQAQLDKINEIVQHGVIEATNLEGIKNQVPTYLIHNLSIGKLKIDEIEASVDAYNSFGRPFLRKYNLCFDYETNTLYFSNNKKKLLEAGIDLNNFIKIPFEIQKMGLVIDVKTDLGNNKFVVSQGSSAIRQTPLLEQLSFVTADNKNAISFSQIEIGRKGIFSSPNFLLCKLPPELDTLGGFLGTDFFKNYCMYIDFENNILYLGDKKPLKSYLIKELKR